jgi:hypothetical protein
VSYFGPVADLRQDIKDGHEDPSISRRTPLNFLAAFFFLAGFFTAMNSPPVLLRWSRRSHRQAQS